MGLDVQPIPVGATKTPDFRVSDGTQTYLLEVKDKFQDSDSIRRREKALDSGGIWEEETELAYQKRIMVQTTPTDPAALARRPDTAGPLAVATPTTRRLADASISLNTRRAYLGALARLDAWRGAALLAAYLGAIFEAGRAPATALAVAAVRFRAKLAGQPAPAGEATARVLAAYRRTAADRGRAQAAPLRADGLAAILATTARPRTDGRGVESHTTAHRRGRLDAVIASLLFMGGLRR